MLLTGGGWGKSTAALGYAVRASSHGWPTTVVQFLKGGGWNASESEMLTHAGIRWLAFTSGLTWGSGDLTQLADQAWQEALSALNNPEGGLVVLDELTRAVDHGLLTAQTVVEAVRGRDPRVRVIMTGKDAPGQLHDLADTVTSFELVKHAAGLGKPFAP